MEMLRLSCTRRMLAVLADKKYALIIRSYRRRGQRTMFPDTYVAGAAHLNR